METTDEKIALLIDRIEFRSMNRLGLIPGYKTFEEWLGIPDKIDRGTDMVSSSTSDGA